MKRRAIYPGSFDPFTRGHHSIVQRALAFMDEVIIAIGTNPAKHACFPPETRQAMIAELYAAEPRVRVVCYSGLTCDLGKQLDARFILRGVRSLRDYEYEMNLADLNRRLTGVETVILFTEPEWAFISSTLVKELKHFGKDITPYIPKGLKYE